MKVECIDKEFNITIGRIYEVVSIDKERNECRVIDESGEDYIYSMDSFEFLYLRNASFA